MNKWVEVDAKKVNRETQETVQGVSVKVSLSPYDVPVRVRGSYEDSSDLFIIELEYPLTGEPTRNEKPSTEVPIELEVGNVSDRIYRIKIDVTKLGCNAIRLEIEQVD